MSVLKLVDMRRNGGYNSIDAPKGNLGVLRSAMPQIDSQYREDFISWLKNQGIKVKTARVPLKSLMLTQSEYDRDKVSSMLDQMDNKAAAKLPPIFTSVDGYVLDGSHRLIAMLNTQKKRRYIDVTEIDMKMLDLLELVRTYPHARYRSLQDKPK